MRRLINAEIWRDGGSLSAVVEADDGRLEAFWLQVVWSKDLKDRWHENLYVSDGSDPLQKTRKVEIRSEQEDELMRMLIVTDVTNSDDEQRRVFAELVQVLRARHRRKADWVQAPQSADLMVLKRFNGDELYPIARAEWNLYEDSEYGHWNLWISIVADFAVSQQEDTVTLNGQPKWEVNWIAARMAISDLIPGFRREIPNGYVDRRDVIRHTNFYYTSHEETDDNIIEIVAVDGDRLKIRLQGTTIDVNHYDGSKPRTKITVETWFTHHPEGRKAIA